MATIANAYDPDDSNNTNVSGGTGTTTPSNPGITTDSGGGTSSTYQGGGAASVAGRPNPTPNAPPNVQQYLNANQGAGQRLSQGITNNVQNQANQYQQGLNTYQNQLSNQYNPINAQVSQGQSTANTAFQDPQALLAAYQAAQSQSGTTNASQTPYTTYGSNGSQYSYNPSTQQWSTAATSTTPSQNVSFQQAFGTPLTQQQALTDYGNLQANVAGTGAYNTQQQQIGQYGATGQQDYNQLQSQLGNLQQTTGSAANQMGQNQLLQNTVGNPNYNPGQQTLDSLFLQGQGNNLQQNLNNIQNTANQNTTNFNNNTQANLQALQQLAGNNASYTQNLFANGPSAGNQGQGLNAIASNVNSALTAAQAAQPAEVQQLQNALSTGKLTTADLNTLGLSPTEQVYGLFNNPANLSQMSSLVQAGGNPTAASVATPEQFARYQALNQLAGNPQSNIFGTATTAGGYTPINFNNSASNGFQSMVNNAQQQDVQNLLNNPDVQHYIQGVNGGANYGFTPQLTSALQSLGSNPNMSVAQIQSLLGPALQSAENSNTYAGQQQYAPLSQLYNQLNNFVNQKPETLGQVVTQGQMGAGPGGGVVSTT